MSLKLPKLEILPTKDLLRHEWHDKSRSKPLVESLKASGELRNPPIVSPLQDGTRRYMVLDGANRTTAFEMMDVPHCLCQVVTSDHPGLSLEKWNHVLWHWPPEDLLESIRHVPDVNLREIDPEIRRPQKRWPQKTIAWLQTPDGKAFIVESVPSGLINRARELELISKAYLKNAHLDRTTKQRIDELIGSYDNLCAIVVYPPFSVQEILELTANDVLLPPGMTRFSVSPRALRVNFPMEILSSDQSLHSKRKYLEEWTRERTREKSIRFYAEATVLYDD